MENSFDPDAGMVSQIAGHVRVGAAYDTACAALGIPDTVAKRWLAMAGLAHAEGRPSIYSDLYDALRKAAAQAECIALQRLAAEGGAGGAKWLLEKLRPDRYGQNGQKKTDNKDPYDSIR